METGYVYLWQYRVRSESIAEFERIYGPHGDWVQLFQKYAGYIRTELYRDLQTPGRYLTVDYWQSAEAYRAFRQASTLEFDALDRACEKLTTQEVFLGEFSFIG